MIRLPIIAGLLLSGCAAEMPASSGGPPSIQAGIWPWFYSSSPRHKQPAQQETRRDIQPPVTKLPENPATPDAPRLPVDKIDEARQRLLEIQQRLNRPMVTRGERLNE